MQVDGQCHCGAIAFEASIDPERVFVCHCLDCQVFSGSAFRVRAILPWAQYTPTRGDPRTYAKTAASGNTRVMHFCGNCGTHVFGADDAVPAEGSFVSVSVATIRQRAQITPVAQVWCRSRLPWVARLDELPQAEQQHLPKV